jgi:hypothetical protein
MHKEELSFSVAHPTTLFPFVHGKKCILCYLFTHSPPPGTYHSDLQRARGDEMNANWMNEGISKVVKSFINGYYLYIHEIKQHLIYEEIINVTNTQTKSQGAKSK